MTHPFPPYGFNLKLNLNFIFSCSPFVFISQSHVMSAFVPTSDPSSRPTRLLCAFFAPTSGAIHKWIASPCNLFLTLYLSCSLYQFSCTTNDPYPPPSAWFHLVPRWLPTRFPSTTGTGVGGGLRTRLHHPLMIRM
jgi:hypothetical protein